MIIHKKILLGLITASILINVSVLTLAQSQQPTLATETPSGTPVRLILQDFASRPIALSPVTINANIYRTDADGVVNVSSLPVGKVDVSVKWKGSVYTWPTQTIEAQDKEQLITLRMPILASYGLTTPRLISLGVFVIVLIALIFLFSWIVSGYKKYKDNKLHSASPYGHVSSYKKHKAAKSNPGAMSFTPTSSDSPKPPAPTHQPMPATPIPLKPAVKKESPAPVLASAPVVATAKPPNTEPIKATPPPQQANTPAPSPAPAKKTPIASPNPAPKPVNKVNGEILPTGIEVHDLTE